MNGLGAAFVTPAIREIPELIKQRNVIAKTYRRMLKDTPYVTCMEEPAHDIDAPWVFAISLLNPQWKHPVRQILADHGIESRSQFLPQHLQHCFLGFGQADSKFPNCESLYMRTFYLPTHNGLNPEDIKYVCAVVNYAIAKVTNATTLPPVPTPPRSTNVMEASVVSSGPNEVQPTLFSYRSGFFALLAVLLFQLTSHK